MCNMEICVASDCRNVIPCSYSVVAALSTVNASLCLFNSRNKKLLCNFLFLQSKHEYPSQIPVELFNFSINTKSFSSRRTEETHPPTHQAIPPKIKRSPNFSVKRQNIVPKVYKKRDMIAKLYNILKYSTSNSAQEELENFSIKQDSETVNQVLRSLPPMEKGGSFLLTGYREGNVSSTISIPLPLMLDVLENQGGFHR